ncbi:MAG: hypothetical protein KF797_10860 [Flavobacteriales bacterium]|nr:hypothetical protein [Flavobacteriales bacterium]
MRWDSVPVGFMLGLLAPVLGFFAYGGIYVTALRPWHDINWFVSDMFLGTSEFRTRIVSISLIADAFLFFLFDRLDKHKAMRGVIMAMLVYALYIVPAIVMDELSKLGWL